MKNFQSLCLVFLSTILFGCCSKATIVRPFSSNASYEQISAVKEEKDVTVALVRGEEEKSAYCTGVWIEQDVFVTADHCVEREKDESISQEDNLTGGLGSVIEFVNYRDALDDSEKKPIWIGIVLATNRMKDIALVKTVGVSSAHGIAKMSDDEPQDGEDADIVGHTVGLWWSYSKGYVSAVRTVYPFLPIQELGMKVVQISSPVWFGNSGGGAFNKKRELIGVCSKVSKQAPNVAFFVHIEEVKKMLSSYRR